MSLMYNKKMKELSSLFQYFKSRLHLLRFSKYAYFSRHLHFCLFVIESSSFSACCLHLSGILSLLLQYYMHVSGEKMSVQYLVLQMSLFFLLLCNGTLLNMNFWLTIYLHNDFIYFSWIKKKINLLFANQKGVKNVKCYSTFNNGYCNKATSQNYINIFK